MLAGSCCPPCATPAPPGQQELNSTQHQPRRTHTTATLLGAKLTASETQIPAPHQPDSQTRHSMRATPGLPPAQHYHPYTSAAPAAPRPPSVDTAVPFWLGGVPPWPRWTDLAPSFCTPTPPGFCAPRGCSIQKPTSRFSRLILSCARILRGWPGTAAWHGPERPLPFAPPAHTPRLSQYTPPHPAVPALQYSCIHASPYPAPPQARGPRARCSPPPVALYASAFLPCMLTPAR